LAKDLEYAILVYLKGNAAKALRDLGKELDALDKKGGAFGGFAQMFGGGIGGRITQALATRPGGVGGMLSDVIKGATSLALVPARILSSFASIIPGIGGIFSSVVGTAANILQGLVGIAANIVGRILNAFAALVGKVAEVMGKVVGMAAKIGLGVGAAIGVALVKGVAENLQEMQLKAILARRLGGGFAAAWAEIEKQFGKTACSQEELAGALTVLARADLAKPERFLQDIADAAVGARMPLEQVADLFLRLETMGTSAKGQRHLAEQFGEYRRQLAEVEKALRRIVEDEPREGPHGRLKNAVAEHRAEINRQEALGQARLHWERRIADAQERRADIIRKMQQAEADFVTDAEMNKGRLAMSLREMGFDQKTIDRIRTVDDLAGALRAKFGGLAQEVARLSPMKKLWQETGEMLETVSEPLTRAIIPAFERLNAWLDHLRDTPAIKSLAAEIGRLATDAIGGLERALDWLSTREFKWSNIVAGLKQAWQEVMPALGEALKATFAWAVEEAKVLLTQLWTWIGATFNELVIRVLDNLRAGLQAAARGVMHGGEKERETEAGRQWMRAGEPERSVVAKGERWKLGWGQLTETEQARWMQRQGLSAPGRIEGLEVKGLMAESNTIESIMRGLINLGQQADGAAAQLQQLQAAAAGAAAARNAALGALGGAAGGALGTALPEAPGVTHKAGPQWGNARPEDLRQMEVLQEAIQRGQVVQAALERSGYQEQSAQVGQRVVQLRQSLEALLYKIMGDIGVLGDNVAGLWATVGQMLREQAAQSDRIKRLGTAR